METLCCHPEAPEAIVDVRQDQGEQRAPTKAYVAVVHDLYGFQQALQLDQRRVGSFHDGKVLPDAGQVLLFGRMEAAADAQAFRRLLGGQVDVFTNTMQGVGAEKESESVSN